MVEEMPRRTIVIDEELDVLLRKVQARLIEKTKKNWSYSKVIGVILSVGFASKNFNGLIDDIIKITNSQVKD